MFGTKSVSDSMLAAVRGVMSAEQKDSEGKILEAGDTIRVSEGDHAGMTGTITGFNTSGRSQVQLDLGRHVELSNENILNESKKLDPIDKSELKGTLKDREDGDIDNDGDEDESDRFLHKRRKAIKKAMESLQLEENCPCGDEDECECGPKCEDCNCNSDDDSRKSQD